MIRLGRQGSRLSVRAKGQEEMYGGRGVISSTFPSWASVRRRLVKGKFQDQDDFTDFVREYRSDRVDPYGLRDHEEAYGVRKATRMAWERFEDRWNDFVSEAYAFTSPLRLWREVTASSVDRIRLDKEVGLYWSWDPAAAEAHWAGGGVPWMLVMEVDPDQVDWPLTFWLNLDMPEEKEIRLKSKAKIRLLRIRDEGGAIVKTFTPPKAVTA